MKDGGPCPDPTRALLDILPELSEKLAGEVELPRMIDALAKAAPVLDGGSYRKQVEALIDNKPTSAGNGDTLSASLSFALLRLRDAGFIRLDRASDSPATTVLSLRADHRSPFSHVSILRLPEVVA